MSIIISNDDTVLDDVIEEEENDTLSQDRATRTMLVRAESAQDARSHISAGDLLPGYINMHATRSNAKPLVCGELYELRGEYGGMFNNKLADIRVIDELESWDSGTRRMIVAASSTAAARDEVDLGDSLSGFSNMRCVRRDAEPIIPGQIYLGQWDYKGFSGTKEAKYIPRSFSEKQSASPANYLDVTGVSLESNQPLVGVTILWFSTSIPSMTVAGTNVTPSYSPGVPSNIWASIANPIHVYPFGWVLDDRQIETIAGTTLCFVTDTYTYYQRYKPGGG